MRKEAEQREAGPADDTKAAQPPKDKYSGKHLVLNKHQPIYSTFDLTFLVMRYLLKLHDNGAFPVDIYAFRRGLADLYEGADRLRFFHICSIPSLMAILGHLWYHKPSDDHSEGGGQQRKQGNQDSKEDKGDAQETSWHDDDKAEDAVTGYGNVNISQHESIGHATLGAKDYAGLRDYFKQAIQPTDKSFDKIKSNTCVVDVEVSDGLLHIIGVKHQIVKKLLLKNYKNERNVDIGLYSQGEEYTDPAATEKDKQENGQLDSKECDEESGKGVNDSAADIDAFHKILQHNTARELTRISPFLLKEKSGFREICAFGTRTECRIHNPMYMVCKAVHFKPIILPNTIAQLGDCSYLDTCRHIETCRFVHYQIDDAPPKTVIDEVSKGQWISCDVRKLDFNIFNPHITVVMADPPWDIHMDLPYGTMKDSEMRNLKVQNIHDEGLLFLWVTGRTLEVGRECMEIWGYRQVDEIVWVKTNQLQRIIRTGRTGHWLNHSKEHCLIGIKGNPVINRHVDCDVVVSEVRETSRKPDEIYRLIERMVPGSLKLEIFGRSHNVRNNWITLGNQLDGYNLTHPEIKMRYENFLNQAEVSSNGDLPKAES